jgi:glycosyltransferase involved in cell wall biosynthesis
MKRCNVSVVIPTYNRAKYLRVALESVISQTCLPAEIIVVDDGSTDNTQEVVRDYIHHIRYFAQTNSGPSAARNLGIRESRHAYIAFLDSDDAWMPYKLEHQMDWFNREPSLGMTGTRYLSCDEFLHNPREQLIFQLAPSDNEEILIRNLWPTPSIIICRRCIEVVGLFDENLRYAEDWDLWMRIASRFPIKTIHEPLVLVRNHKDSLIASHDNILSNFYVWLQLIQRNKVTYDMGSIPYRKALSWYYLNVSYHYQVLGNRYLESRFLSKSIAAWPFFSPRRFAALAKKLIYTLYSK